MKHLSLLKTFLIACFAMLLGGSAAAQTTETIDLTTKGYADKTEVNSVDGTDFSLSFTKGGTNTPKYYTNGTAVRIYKNGGSMIVSSSKVMTKIVITFGDNTAANVASTGYDATTGTWTGESQSVTFTASATTRIQKVEVTFALEEGAVAVPTITPASGTLFDESQEVTITAADATHTVWYTTDDSEPEADGATSTKYTAPFTIEATTTVKAIAVDANGNASSVVSANYTKKEWLAGLEALVAKIKADNSTNDKTYYVNLAGAVLTGINGSNAYLEEGEAGILLYKKDHGLTVGSKYSSKTTVTAKMYKGLPELTSFDFTVETPDAELPLTPVTIADLNANFDKYVSRRVQITDAVVTVPLLSFNAEVVQGEEALGIYSKPSLPQLAKNAIVDIVGGWPTINTDYTPSQYLTLLESTVVLPKGFTVVFRFQQVEAEARVDAPFTGPVLENTYEEKNVTYTSSKPEVATVDATSGEVTILAEGTTTISATLSLSNETTVQADYTLTVKPSLANHEGYYYLVTSAEELVPDARYLIASATNNMVMSTNQKDKNRGEIEATKEVGVITGFVAGEFSACEFVLKAGNKPNTFAFYDENKEGYLYAAASGNNYLKTEGTLSDNSSATIEIDAAGIATIKFQGENTHNWLRHNSSSNLFACYESNTQNDVQLYKLYTEQQGGDITAIESAEQANAADNKVYNLAGVCVGKNLKALPKGCYIVGGKKVIVR